MGPAAHPADSHNAEQLRGAAGDGLRGVRAVQQGPERAARRHALAEAVCARAGTCHQFYGALAGPGDLGESWCVNQVQYIQDRCNIDISIITPLFVLP